MSRIIYICFIVTTMFMSSACSDKKNYTIEAKIVNLEGKPIYVIQDKYNEIMNSNQINEILDSGRDKTMQIAKEKTYEVFKKVGFGRY